MTDTVIEREGCGDAGAVHNKKRPRYATRGQLLLDRNFPLGHLENCDPTTAVNVRNVPWFQKIDPAGKTRAVLRASAKVAAGVARRRAILSPRGGQGIEAVAPSKRAPG